MTGENSTQRLRLFVAIPVPNSVREKMLAAQRELQSLAPPGAVRWTKPEQFHLTLRFLGNVSSDRVAALQESVRGACSGAPVLPLRTRGIGFFPNARSPRVIWVGVNDDKDRLVDLQRKIESAVRLFSAEPAGDHFAGHVTLGRFKAFDRRKIQELTTKADEMKTVSFGEWTATTVELVRSELSENVAVHTALATFLLGQIEPV